ncbi:MAG: acetyl-CoA carboxylase, carboxyltransferase subunit beta [Planctomycetota bacterium]
MATTASSSKTWGETAQPVKKSIPEGLWLRCPSCGQMIYRRQMEADRHLCPECGFHFRLGATERARQLADEGSFVEMFEGLESADPLGFKDLKVYSARLDAERAKTGRPDAILAGEAFIKGRPAVIACLDLSFMMGSMGCVVGEVLTRSIEHATAKRLPLIIVSGSGGARMQESTLSLMQMAKTSAALARHDAAGLLYVSVLTDPTTGGVTASFAMLGDIIIAEPGALVGFAGPRVIKQTIRQDLPEGFQRAEFLVESGMVDMVVPRRELRSELARLIDYAGG